MSSVDELLAGLADAARRNEKADFDRLERELLSHFGGSFDAMPEEMYQRYLDVDRHWPIAVATSGNPPDRRRTLQVRLGTGQEAWLQEVAVSTDRSLSAVIAECIDAIRGEPQRASEVRERLRRGRSLLDE
jgi:hypothetical protein